MDCILSALKSKFEFDLTKGIKRLESDSHTYFVLEHGYMSLEFETISKTIFAFNKHGGFDFKIEYKPYVKKISILTNQASYEQLKEVINNQNLNNNQKIDVIKKIRLDNKEILKQFNAFADKNEIPTGLEYKEYPIYTHKEKSEFYVTDSKFIIENSNQIIDELAQASSYEEHNKLDILDTMKMESNIPCSFKLNLNNIKSYLTKYGAIRNKDKEESCFENFSYSVEIIKFGNQECIKLDTQQGSFLFFEDNKIWNYVCLNNLLDVNKIKPYMNEKKNQSWLLSMFNENSFFDTKNIDIINQIKNKNTEKKYINKIEGEMDRKVVKMIEIIEKEIKKAQ